MSPGTIKAAQQKSGSSHMLKMPFRLHRGLKNARKARKSSPRWVTLETFVIAHRGWWMNLRSVPSLLIAFRHEFWGLEGRARTRTEGDEAVATTPCFSVYTATASTEAFPSRNLDSGGQLRCQFFLFPSGSYTPPYWGDTLISNTSSVCQPSSQPACSISSTSASYCAQVAAKSLSPPSPFHVWLPGARLVC